MLIPAVILLHSAASVHIGMFMEYWTSSGAVKPVSSEEFLLFFSGLLARCSTVKLYGEGGRAATRHRKAVPPLLPVESGVLGSRAPLESPLGEASVA